MQSPSKGIDVCHEQGQVTSGLKRKSVGGRNFIGNSERQGSITLVRPFKIQALLSIEPYFFPQMTLSGGYQLNTNSIGYTWAKFIFTIMFSFSSAMVPPREVF